MKICFYNGILTMVKDTLNDTLGLIIYTLRSSKNF